MYASFLARRLAHPSSYCNTVISLARLDATVCVSPQKLDARLDTAVVPPIPRTAACSPARRPAFGHRGGQGASVQRVSPVLDAYPDGRPLVPAPPEHEPAQRERFHGGLPGEEPSRGVRGTGKRALCGVAAPLRGE